MICTFVQKICESVGLPCAGFLRQMIRYASHSTSSTVSSVSDSIFTDALSTIFWIFCTSSYQQLLVLLYGLYDVYDENSMDRDMMCSLLSDLFGEENDVRGIEF